MKCSDIPEAPILRFLVAQEGKRWGTWFSGFENSVAQAMPADIPEKLVLAKMRQLLKRGAVDGCGCGCRGDFRITEKGRDLLKRQIEERSDTASQLASRSA